MAGHAKQASFLIGPPAGPEDMKALYDQAEKDQKNGDDRLSKKLFGLRQSAIKYITLPDSRQKPMLQRVLEEKLGKEIQKIESSVEQSYVRGSVVPNLTISLENTLYADGSPIGPDLSADIVKTLENVFGFMFKAQWVQSSVK